MRYLYITIALVTLIPVSAHANKIYDDTYGCFLQEDYWRVVKLDGKDRSLLKALIKIDMCRILKMGDSVILEKEEDGVIRCVIPKDETRCLWINRLMVSSK